MRAREATRVLVHQGVSRLLVARDEQEQPEGVVSEFDLLAAES